MPKNTNDFCAPDAALGIRVLMAMNKPSRSRSCDITVEGRKAIMHFVVFIVDLARRIMCDKNIHRRKPRQQRFHFLLFEKIIAPRFVFP